MKIESQLDRSQDCLKVIYEGKHGKLFPLEGLTYDEFVKRLFQVYKLPPVHSSNYYHLYFIDSDKDNISIRDQEDFATFLTIPERKKLYLTHTNNQDLHFQTQKHQKQKPTMNQEEIGRIINEKRQQLLAKIQHRLPCLKEALRKEMEMLIDQQRVMPIHQGIKCEKCSNGKSITGTRYQCITCKYNICENCEQNDDHPHPLFKILNESQFIAIKKNKLFLDVDVKSYANPNTKKWLGISPTTKKKEMPPFYEQFKAITNLSDQKAQAIIESHPKMGLEQLIQYFLTTQ